MPPSEFSAQRFKALAWVVEDAENGGAAGLAEVDGVRAFGETGLDRRCSGQVIGAADPQKQVDESLHVLVIDVNAAQHHRRERSRRAPGAT